LSVKTPLVHGHDFVHAPRLSVAGESYIHHIAPYMRAHVKDQCALDDLGDDDSPLYDALPESAKRVRLIIEQALRFAQLGLNSLDKRFIWKLWQAQLMDATGKRLVCDRLD
jgi:hypothetical protein